MRDLAEGGYIERAEPVLFIEECGTGNTHLLTSLCVTMPAETSSPLYDRYDLIAIDEVGYVPLAEVGAESLFQVVAERAEKAGRYSDYQSAIFGVDTGDPERTSL
jgi:hypothetical protein